MPDCYIVQANITTFEGGRQRTRQVPTFFLPTHILGIVSVDHAERIARNILSGEGRKIHLCAAPVE
jgi:hypothetical protein